MIIGVLKITFKLFGCKSIKAKRSIIKPLINSLKTKFNISVSEISMMDNLDVGVIGIACISNSTKFVNQQISEIENFLDNFPEIMITNIESQVL